MAAPPAAAGNGEGAEGAEGGKASDMRCGAVARKILHLVGTVLVIIPVVIFIVVVFGFGGLMAAIEGWTFSDGAK